MSGNYYLVARDVNTNDFKMIRGFDTLEQADIYTTNCHNSKDLRKKIWKGGIIPSQELDFFLVKERSNKESVKTMDVLYSDSKEIRNIALRQDNESVDNLVEHFYTKLITSPNFYSLVASTINVRKLFDKCISSKGYIESSELMGKDENGNYKEYPALRKMVEALSRYEDKKKKKNKLNRTLLDRLIIERSVLQRLNSDENQISFFDYIDRMESEDNKEEDIVETLDMIDRLPNGFTYIKKGIVHVSNNIYTTGEDLEKLDSLLDQEFGYVLNDYLSNRSMLDTITDIDEIKKQNEIIKQTKLRLIDILSNRYKVLNNTKKLMSIVSENQSKLLGDDYGYQYQK